MSLSTRKRTILAKLETTYGVDSTPSGGANAILCRNLTFTPVNASLVNRDLIRPYFGNSDTMLAEISAMIEFEVELAGSGTAGTAPGWDALLQACAFSQTISAGVSVTYDPISDNLKSATIYFNVDGILHKLTGARGTVSFDIGAKNIPVMKYKFTGIYNDPADVAAPTVDFSAFQIPKVANTLNTPSFSLFSYSGALETLSIDMACDVQHRTLIGSDSILLLDRKPAGTMVIEAPHIATKDFFTIAKNNTPGAMSIQHGLVAGNIVTLSAGRVTIGNPNYQDSQNVQMLSIPFTITPTSGNDEISIVLT